VDTAERLKLPIRIGNFVCERELGAGAMGEVYLAREDITGREIAVKVMAKHLAANAHALRCFRREITAFAQLAHPGVPACTGYGEHEGRPWMAMEFIRGRSVEEFIRGNSRLPEHLALWIVHEMAGIMAYCNQSVGMIHRDLKPANTMILGAEPDLGPHCQVKIIDYGLALYVAVEDPDDYGAPIRQTGHAMMPEDIAGTPFFMSPEQFAGVRLDFHSDMYSMGVILFRLCTGRMPFVSTDIKELARMHTQAPIPDPQTLAQISTGTALIIRRLLAKEPHARYRTYPQLQSALEGALIEARAVAARTARGEPPSSGSRTAAMAAILPPGSGSGWRRPTKPVTPDGDEGQPPAGWRRP
jgi:serine/threonine protein kinase